MARGIWKGTLGFGLVNIGVELFSGDQPNALDLDMLDKRDLSRIGYQKFNKTTGKIVQQSDIVKGMAVAKDRYVVLTAEDLKAANPKATQAIEMEGFVDASAIDLVYFDRVYYVLPLKGSEKAYGLLRDALRESGKIGIAQFVIRTRQYTAAVYPHGEALVVHALRYHDELRDPAELGITKLSGHKAQTKEVAMAEQLIESMTMDFKPSAYSDTYRSDLLKLVKTRARSGGKKSPPLAKESEAPEPRVHDLMEALRQSVQDKRRRTPTSRRPTKVSRSLSRRSA
ncbi:MAG TPA: Ku protein [Planctomycetota bacterium]|nr:Ku protein [Planctomycetota bacterium]